ncbi:MAG: thioredoxin family protein [Elusimicrobia bacterium]|nr:thioredoxin family protein [Elusimicrobiota bacterium]
MRRILGAVFAGLIIGGGLSASAVEVGEAAPDFSLQDIQGKMQSLAKRRGQFVVLEWVNHGCPFVKKHYDSGNMQALQKEFTGKGVQWLSICSSAEGKQGNMSPAQWRITAKEKGGFATAILLDDWGRVGHLYGAKTTPHMFIVDPKGILIYQGAIDDTPSTDPADVKTAANYVRAALDEALAGKPVTTGETKPYGCGVKYK